MTIIDGMINLRNDLKTWISKQLPKKLNKNLGSSNKNKILVVNESGDVITRDTSFIKERFNEQAKKILSFTSIGLDFECTTIDSEGGTTVI